MGESEILDKWFEGTAEKKMRRHQFTEPGFDEIAKSIGRLLLAWNDLHEKLCSIFITALGGGWVGRPLALWHSIRSDGGKRNLLQVAIENVPPIELGLRTKLVKEVKWILCNAQELEGKRDDAAHTPLINYEGPQSAVVKALAGTLVFADDFMFNRRAQRINKDKLDLLKEFEHARKRIIILRDYAIAIDLAWSNARYPWPDRPEMPNPPPRKMVPPPVEGGRKNSFFTSLDHRGRYFNFRIVGRASFAGHWISPLLALKTAETLPKGSVVSTG